MGGLSENKELNPFVYLDIAIDEEKGNIFVSSNDK